MSADNSDRDKVYTSYREKYLNAPRLALTAPVDVSLELSSFCNMGCTYCLDPETPVLTGNLAWRPIKDLREGDPIVAFDEFSPGDKKNRAMRRATVEKVWTTEKETVRLVTTHGDVVCSLDHKFLDISSRWTKASNLEVGQAICFGEEPWESGKQTLDYIQGYMLAMTVGDGTARWLPLEGSTGKAEDPRRQVWWRVALKDVDALHRIVGYLDELGIEHPGIKPFSPARDGYAPMDKIEIRGKESLAKLHAFLYGPTNTQPDFEKGYLAGIFDAEGSCCQEHGVVRISQKQPNDVLDRTEAYMTNLGFQTTKTKNEVRLKGGVWEVMRFMGITQPAIERKACSWADVGIRHKRATVIRIEPLGVRKLIDIQTSTRTFYGAGFATHNCYHGDKKHLPFKQSYMLPETIKRILNQAADAGVSSVKFNWRGESTMNPFFAAATAHAKALAKDAVFVDRLTNSNFKFDSQRDDVFKGLCNQTKVKVSYDSFRPEVFEAQRKLGNHALTTANIDRFYNWPGRNNVLVIQAVRTRLNADEDIEGQAKRRWPSALISIRDMVGGRVDRDLGDITHKERDYSERQSCIQAHARLIFDWDGMAVPCCPDIKQQLKLGNIRDKSLLEIFNSQEAFRLRQDLLSGKAFESSPCKNCSSFETYKGFSPSFDS